MHRTSIALSLLLGACAASPSPLQTGARGTLYSPTENGEGASWSGPEREQPVAVRNLRRTPEASFHLLHLRSEQPARVHQRSDLVLMALAGRMTVALSGRNFALNAGDVLELPRGATYALRNDAAGASVAYLVYTPALAADDTTSVAASGKAESAWKWNLWVQ